MINIAGYNTMSFFVNCDESGFNTTNFKSVPIYTCFSRFHVYQTERLDCTTCRKMIAKLVKLPTDGL